MVFKSIIGKVMEELEKEGRVKSLSLEGTNKIDHEFALKLEPIKRGYQRLENGSRAYINYIESTTAEM